MTMHLLGHAVFKSMLFMVVGIVLHSVGMQDSRMLPAIAIGGVMTTAVLVCIYQSLGWMHSPTWLTKKTLVDLMQSMGPSTWGLSLGALVGCATSVAYTMVLYSHLLLGTRSSATPAAYAVEHVH